MKRLLLFATTFLLIISTVSAQQFQWIRGGGTNGGPSYSGNTAEATLFICTDANGNIYALSRVNSGTVHADTFSGTTYVSDASILVTSYNCSGQMRWTKLITSTAGPCSAYGMAVDSLGHIYIGGYMAGNTLHVGSNSISGHINQPIALVQLDTLGNFNWIKYVGDNVPATYAASMGEGAVCVDSNDNVHFFNAIQAGVQLTPSLVSHLGNYDLEYSPSGNLLGARRLLFDSTLEMTGAAIDKSSNKVYVMGCRNGLFWNGGTVGGDSTASNFIAAFDTTRNLLWIDTISTAYNIEDVVLGITTDDKGNVYTCGRGYYNFVFAGNTYNPVSSTAFALSYVMRLDMGGNLGWIKLAYSNYGVDYLGITALPTGKVAAIGSFVGYVVSGGMSINSPTNYAPCYTVMDSTGMVIALQRIHGDGSYDYGRCITADQIGNLYIGGSVSDTLPDTLINSYHSIGGPTDFFVLKYGVDCSCTSMPVADYTYSGTGTINVTYTGTTTGLDSVVWNFGDGTTGYGLTASHTYTVVGAVDLCVTVYTSCGHDIKCSNILVNCPVAPASAFTWSGFHPVSFTYTGTTAALDSVVWNYGDGGTGAGLTPSHTYAATGTYTVCATVYTPCGSNTACNVISVACLSAPVAAFSDTGTHTVGFAYTGTTTALDSVVWSYGDGITGNGLSPLHTYTTSGTYHACATAYTACGSDSVCHEIVIHTVGVSTIGTAAMQVYPNPAMNELLITGISIATSYRLLSVTGQCVGQGLLSAGANAISIKENAPGIYILEITAGSDRHMVRVVKE